MWQVAAFLALVHILVIWGCWKIQQYRCAICGETQPWAVSFLGKLRHFFELRGRRLPKCQLCRTFYELMGRWPHHRDR